MGPKLKAKIITKQCYLTPDKKARKSSADQRFLHRVEKFVGDCYAGNLICVLFNSLWLPCLLPFDIQDSQAYNDMH